MTQVAHDTDQESDQQQGVHRKRWYARRRHGRRSRTRQIAFWYTTLELATLAALAYWFKTAADTGFLSQQADVLTAAWFAMLGGVAISYKGIFDHRGDAQWTDGWLLWYIGRPFSSFIVGIVTFMLLQVANTKDLPSPPALAIAAFTLGTQERRFFAFLYEVAKLVLNTPAEQQTGLTVTTLNPGKGAPGSPLLIQGSGFKAGTSVTVGGARMTKLVPSADGSSIAGIVPDGLAGTVADVVVTNPDDTAMRASTKFTYQ